MESDSVSEHVPDHHRDSGDATDISIALPRPALDNAIGDLPEIPPQQQVWRYDQHGKRGKHYRYTGHVKRIGGTEGDRIRRELAAVIRDLLDWAKQQTDTPETQSRQDGGADGHPE